MAENTINTIIFDLIGVVFSIHKIRVLRNIGNKDLIYYFLKRRINPIDEGIFILDRMRKEIPGQFQEVVSYKGTFLPNCFLQWNQGLITRAQAFEHIHNYFSLLDSQGYFIDKQHKKIMFNLLSTLFSSELGLDVFRPIKSTLTLVKKLRKQGKYKLYILTNIDKDTFDGLKELYQPVFNLFDGVVTSCYSSYLKPDSAIFKYLCDQYGLTPEACCFIDDQIENITTAQQLGMQTIHCIKPSELALHLKKHNLI